MDKYILHLYSYPSHIEGAMSFLDQIGYHLWALSLLIWKRGFWNSGVSRRSYHCTKSCSPNLLQMESNIWRQMKMITIVYKYNIQVCNKKKMKQMNRFRRRRNYRWSSLPWSSSFSRWTLQWKKSIGLTCWRQNWRTHWGLNKP
jgi:hypothetical protein